MDDRRTAHVTVLACERGGRYPGGHSLLIHGSEETAIVDPSLSVVARASELPAVDRVLNSHAHEDHIAGNHLFPGVPWHVHPLDLPSLRSIDELIASLAFDEYPDVAAAWRETVLDDFHYVPRPDALTFEDGDVLDLGGVRVTVLHAPGHTAGHCCFLVEPDGVLFLADVDLSSFGPYYGDKVSSLEEFERTLAMLRPIEAGLYVTFHHVGVIEDRATFLERMDRYGAVFERREGRLLEYLSEPRTVDEIVAHRFVYRISDQVAFADPVERRSMTQHLERLLRAGAVAEVEPGRYRSV